MFLMPAIDLRGGNVVRLLRGDYNQETKYDKDPVGTARFFVDCGAEVIHVVDLDGAKDGQSHNFDIIKRIAESTDAVIECGGGIRNIETAARMIDCGVGRIVMGTKATDKDLVASMVKEFGVEKIVIGIDAVDGKVKTEGWLEDSGLSVIDLCAQVLDCGVRHVVYTDISRDGTLEGPNIESLKKVLEFNELQVVASGGVGNMDHIDALVSLGAENLFGIITGKAIYEGTIDLKTAVLKCKEA